MKILFICENYFPHYGGAEILFKNLAENYAKQGHQVTILTQKLKQTKAEEEINAVCVKRINTWYSRYLFSFFAIPKALTLAKKHDLIQTTTFNGAFPAWISAKLTKKPVVLTVHEVWIGKWPEITEFSWLKSKIHDLLERTIYLLPFNQYICVSNATRNDLLKLNIKKEKVRTIYNGLDYEFWNPSKVNQSEIERLRLSWGKEKKFIYFSWGRPGESKGFKYLIKAVPLIKRNIPDSLLLLMLGSTEKYQKKYQQLVELIKKNHLENDIKIIPSQSYEQLKEIIIAVDCIVIPSTAEGFGYTTAEAVAMNKPVVVSNAGSLPEIVSGDYHLFESKNSVDLADKVTKIANKDYLYKGPKRFEWNESVANYQQVYQELLNKFKEKK